MITKPDLLFRKDIEEIAEEEDLQLTSVKCAKKADETFEREYRLGKDFLKTLDKNLRESFSPNVPVFKPTRFPEDLGLDTIVKDFMQPRYTPKFVLNALSKSSVDIPTIRYRWETIDELMEDRQKLGQLKDIAKQLSDMVKLVYTRDKLLERKLFFSIGKEEIILKLLETDVTLMNYYVESVNAFEKVLSGSNSEGLLKVHEYAKRVKETEEFKALSDAIQRYMSEQYVEIGVTLDGLNTVQKAEYLAVGEHKLDRSTIKKLLNRMTKKKKLESILNPGFRFAAFHGRWLFMAMEMFVIESLKQIESTINLVGDIDFYDGAIRYHDILVENDLPATRPEFSGLESRTHEIRGMYHPMINHNKCPLTGKVCFIGGSGGIVPNDFAAEPESNIFIVTGPNNGGKTRYSTGMGLVFALGQAGLHVPARHAKMSLIDNIFTHFVSGGAAENRNGRWVDEISRIKEMLSGMTPYSLSLIDDFGSGTNYLEAREPALDVIYCHHRLGPVFVMNSHLHQLALDVEKGQFPAASNWQVEAKESGDHADYTFRVVPGRAGRSYAKEIAGYHGLSKRHIDEMIAERIEKGELPEGLIKPAKEINYD